MKNWQAFGDSSIAQFKNRLESQTGYIIIKHDDPGYLEYVTCGRIYQKLVSEIRDHYLRPAMHVLEDFGEMKSLNQRFRQEYCQDGEILMIIGLQHKTGKLSDSNPRHLVEDILVK